MKQDLDSALTVFGDTTHNPNSPNSFDLIICSQYDYVNLLQGKLGTQIPFVVISDHFESFDKTRLPFEICSSWNIAELLFRLRSFRSHFTQMSIQGMVEIRGQRIMVNGKILELGRVLESILIVFIKNQNRVLGPLDFLPCFEKAPTSGTNLFAVYVSKLRKKCRELGIHSLRFTSIRNRGYVLNIL